MNDQLKQLELDLHKAGMLPSVTIEGRYDVLARFLYDSGYRKQTNGEWLMNFDGCPCCSVCHQESQSGQMTDTCFNCGANMNGD